MKTQQAGFTLIELVIVIVVLGILAAVAVPTFTDLSGQAEEATFDGIKGAILSQAAIEYAQNGGSASSTADIINGVQAEGWEAVVGSNACEVDVTLDNDYDSTLTIPTNLCSN